MKKIKLLTITKTPPRVLEIYKKMGMVETLSLKGLFESELKVNERKIKEQLYPKKEYPFLYTNDTICFRRYNKI